MLLWFTSSKKGYTLLLRNVRRTPLLRISVSALFSAPSRDTNEKFVPVYNLPIIQGCAAVNKVKRLNLLACGGTLPLTYAASLAGLIEADISLYLTVFGAASTALLFILGGAVTRLVGFIYMTEDGQLVKISYVDEWGRRRDAIHSSTDIGPLHDCPQPLNRYYKFLKVSSCEKPYLISFNSEDDQDGYWFLIDTAFSCLRSSTEKSQRGNIIKSIEGFLGSVKGWTFLSNVDAKDYFVWLVGNLTNALSDNDLGDFHERITSSLIFLLKDLSSCQPVLFNVVLDTYLKVIQGILNNLEEIKWELCPEIPIMSQSNVPFGIKNNFSKIPMNKNAVSPILSCFYEMCSKNLELILEHSLPLHHRITESLNGLVELVSPHQKHTLVQLMLTLTSRSPCCLSDTVWETLSCEFASHSSDPVYRSLFYDLLEMLRFKKDDHKLQLNSIILILEYLSSIREDTDEGKDHVKWLDLAKFLLENISSNDLLLIDVGSLLSKAFTVEILYDFLEEYFYKTARYYVSHFQLDNQNVSCLRLSSLDLQWEQLTLHLNCKIDQYYMCEEEQLKILEDLLRIFSISNKIKSLEYELNCKLTVYELITERFFNLFSTVDFNMKTNDIQHNLAKLGIHSLFVLEEQNLFKSKHLVGVFDFFLLPWDEKSNQKYIESLKPIFYDGLIFLLYLGLNENDSSQPVIDLIEIMSTIPCVDDFLLDKYLFSLIIMSLLPNKGERTSASTQSIAALLESEQLEIAFKSSQIRRILPCFLAGDCLAIRDRNGIEVKCIFCDLNRPNCIQAKIIHFEEYFEFIALRFLEILTKPHSDTSVKREFLDSLHRYVYHLPVLKSDLYLKKIPEVIMAEVLGCNLSISRVMKCLLYDSDGQFILKNAQIVVGTVIDFFKNPNNKEASVQLPNLLEFLMGVTKYSKDFLIDTVKVLFLALFDVSTNLVEIQLLKKTLQDLLSGHNITVRDMLMLYEKELSEIWVDLILMNIQNEKIAPKDSLTYIADVFDMDAKSFLEFRSTPYIVAYVVRNCTNEFTPAILACLSEILETSVKNIITKCFVIVFPLIYFMDDDNAVIQSLHFIEMKSEKELETLIYYSFKNLVCYVIMNLNKPLKVLRFFMKFVHKEEGASSQKASEILSSYSLGFLTFVDEKLSSKSSPLFIVKSCLRAIHNLIVLLGANLDSSIRIKLLASLRTGLPLHYDSFPRECLIAWSIFLYCVELSFIQPYLVTIIKLLVPLLSPFSSDVCQLLYYLIVKNGHFYEDYLPELFFLNKYSSPSMMPILDKIKETTTRMEFSEGLKTTLEHIKYGVPESRINSLEYLLEQLKSGKSKIVHLINDNADVPILIYEMVDCLMMNVHYGNREVQVICAKCLAEMGAVNPAKFSYSLHRVEPKKFVEIENEDFAFQLLSELTKSIQKSEDSHSYNTIANSIQELLKLYFSDQESEKVELFLKRFSQTETIILKSMLGSKYVYNPQEYVITKDKFGSCMEGSIFEWATSWATSLVSFMPSDSFVKNLFSTCLPAIQVDPETMEALLPHILLQSILSCSEENAMIIEKELKGVLKFRDKNIVLPLNSTALNELFSSQPEVESIDIVNVTDEKRVAVVLDLIDFLYKYFSHLKISKTTNDKLPKINEFLSKFSTNSISLMSYCFKDYCRSLFYLERKNSNLTLPNVAPLRNIYAKLNDVDGILGIIRISKSIPTNEECLLNYVVSGQIQDAVRLCEVLRARNPQSTDYFRSLLACYNVIESPAIAVQLARAHAKGSTGSSKSSFCSELAEALWKTLEFDDFRKLVDSMNDEMRNNWSWSVDIGQAYLDFAEFKMDSMKSKIQTMYQCISERLAAITNTTIGAYRQGYNHIVNLHLLNELEMFGELAESIFESKSQVNVTNVLESISMKERLDLLPSDGYYAEKVMNSRLQLLSMINNFKNVPVPVKKIIETELGLAYLRSSKIARKKSNFLLCSTYLALAEQYQPLGLFIEKAKLQEAKHDADSAIAILQQGIQLHSQPTNECLDASLRKLSARAKLLIARYNEENMNVDYNEVTKGYQQAISTYPTEKSHVFLAKYLYKIFSADISPDRTSNKCEIQFQAIKSFGNSLLLGTEYIYQSMFCMISLWLDYGSRYKAYQETGGLSDFHSEYMEKMHKVMGEFFETHPSYMYMAVFSQLISRINHPLSKCRQSLIQIISKVAVDYPYQAFWMLTPIWKTDDSALNKFGNLILQKMKQLEISSLSKIPVAKFYSVFSSLVDILIAICNKKTPPHTLVVPLQNISPKLKSLLKSNPDQIMIPAQKFRTICLPKNKNFCNSEGIQHNPFPLAPVYFADVDDKVIVLYSLQKPKKLTFKGSDGLDYPFMCKPMDDLTIDSRVMEFCSVVNMYLQRDPPSCDRNLNIKTYSVVPINPVNGIIEWVPNLEGYRSVINKMFKMKSIKTPSGAEVRNKIEACKTPEQKLKLFEEVLLPLHPPVLQKWFFHQFSSPDSWYHARISFSRTAAVMSIVGYVVGLGDRHGENILLDVLTGEIMHVDFNCLFGKGELLQVPEVVPFRLTQNMVKAMGTTEIEGHFMKSCEVTNRVIRNNADQLLYALKPFLHDPKLQKNARAEEKAKSDINIIIKKMSGFVITPKKKTQALSVEGQVRCLVSEATSHQNLSLMYFGWNPFL